MSSWTRLNRPQTILFSYFLRAQIRHQRRYESDVPCVIHKTWRERKSQSAARQILEQTRDTFDNGIVCRSCVCTLYIIMRHTCILFVWYTHGRVCPFPRISRSFSGFVNNSALKLFIIQLVHLVTNFSNKKIFGWFYSVSEDTNFSIIFVASTIRSFAKHILSYHLRKEEEKYLSTGYVCILFMQLDSVHIA